MGPRYKVSTIPGLCEIRRHVKYQKQSSFCSAAQMYVSQAHLWLLKCRLPQTKERRTETLRTTLNSYIQ